MLFSPSICLDWHIFFWVFLLFSLKVVEATNVKGFILSLVICCNIIISYLFLSLSVYEGVQLEDFFLDFFVVLLELLRDTNIRIHACSSFLLI